MKSQVESFMEWTGQHLNLSLFNKLYVLFFKAMFCNEFVFKKCGLHQTPDFYITFFFPRSEY